MNTKLHAICDSQGRPLNLFVTAGQVSDYIGARALLPSLPSADWMLADRGDDADWFREGLKEQGINPGIPALNSGAHHRGRVASPPRLDGSDRPGPGVMVMGHLRQGLSL